MINILNVDLKCIEIDTVMFVITYDNVGGVGSAVPCTESGGGQFAIRKWVVRVWCHSLSADDWSIEYLKIYLILFTINIMLSHKSILAIGVIMLVIRKITVWVTSTKNSGGAATLGFVSGINNRVVWWRHNLVTMDCGLLCWSSPRSRRKPAYPGMRANRTPSFFETM